MKNKTYHVGQAPPQSYTTTNYTKPSQVGSTWSTSASTSSSMSNTFVSPTNTANRKIAKEAIICRRGEYILIDMQKQARKYGVNYQLNRYAIVTKLKRDSCTTTHVISNNLSELLLRINNNVQSIKENSRDGYEGRLTYYPRVVTSTSHTSSVSASC